MRSLNSSELEPPHAREAGATLFLKKVVAGNSSLNSHEVI